MELSQINSDLINVLINNASLRRDKMRELRGRFELNKKDIPIYNRKFIIDGVEQSDLVNNPVHVDFMGNIINTKIGYLFGNPLDVQIEDDNAQQVIYDFMQRTYFDDVIAEIGTDAAIAGYGVNMLFVNPDGLADMKSVDPDECLFFGSDILNPELVIRFFSKEEIENNEIVVYDYAECYDKTAYKTYRVKNLKYQTKTDLNEWVEYTPETIHGFSDIPLIAFKNNDNLKGDCENVIDSMDAYDRVLTDELCDIEQYRMDYLVIKGDLGDKPDEAAQKLKKMRIMYLKNDADGKNTQDAYFITRLLPLEKVDATLDRNKKEIYEMTRHLNVSDDNMGSASSGVALKNKQQPFEYKCLEAEREFKASLTKMFKLLSEFWGGYQINVNYLDIQFIFTRNYAQNKLEEAEIFIKLAAVLPLEIVNQITSFDIDIDELTKLIEEKQNEEATKLKEQMIAEEQRQADLQAQQNNTVNNEPI